MAPGTIGMMASRIRNPRPCSASQACTPPPASSPNADPPDNAIASICSTMLTGSSSAPSRVPGPPPRTSIAATAGESKTTAVTPDARAASSAWPTRTPAISGRRVFIACSLRGAQMTARLRSGQPRRSTSAARWRHKNAPANRGVGCRNRIYEALRPLRIDLGVVALGVPFVDNIVDLLDVALGIELHLANHRIPRAAFDRIHDFLRIGCAGLRHRLRPDLHRGICVERVALWIDTLGLETLDDGLGGRLVAGVGARWQKQSFAGGAWDRRQ